MFGCDYMNFSSDNIREKELFNILSSIKMASLLFAAILFLNQCSFSSHSNEVKITDYANILSVSLFVVLFVALYLLWYFFSIKSFQLNNYKKILVIENFIFITLFSLLIINSNTSDSPYKLLFIFIVIISTLQLGMNYGMIIAIASSALILVIDLIMERGVLINIQFQKDLTLAAIFISISAALGHYVKFENENLKIKNLHLQALSNEIEEMAKHRKSIEDILLSNELCYNLLFKSSGNALIVHRDSSIIYANESAAKLLGYEIPEKLTGMSFLEFLDPLSKDKANASLSDLYEKNLNLVIFEGKLKDSYDRYIDVLNTSTKFIYDGKPTILSILQNITSDKQVEKLQRDVEKNIELLNETREFNRLITEFFSNISHELKTPLNVIYSAIQVLDLHRHVSENNFLEKHDKYNAIIKQNCFRLMRLINNLLDLTRLDSGFLKLNLENHNIVTIIENISLSVVTYMESKGLNLIFDTDTEEKIIAVDPDKIERIILNLLSNACKFTNSGGEISVTIADLGEEISISVKDTGIGIPSDKLELIFERFGQVDKTLKRFHEGSGIGLSLVKSFAEMHNGRVSINSTVGSGSEFIIYLPVKVLEHSYSEEISLYESNIERINIEFSDIYSDA
jgi:PAS domain S-box-containing protein